MRCYFCNLCIDYKLEALSTRCDNCDCFIAKDGLDRIKAISFYRNNPGDGLIFCDYHFHFYPRKLTIQYRYLRQQSESITIDTIPEIDPNNLMELFNRVNKLKAFL